MAVLTSIVPNMVSVSTAPPQAHSNYLRSCLPRETFLFLFLSFSARARHTFCVWKYRGATQSSTVSNNYARESWEKPLIGANLITRCNVVQNVLFLRRQRDIFASYFCNLLPRYIATFSSRGNNLLKYIGNLDRLLFKDARGKYREFIMITAIRDSQDFKSGAYSAIILSA